MDLREKKTKRSIKNAFIQLRTKKPLERITVKELSELAQISKATFYLHYHDIYDLSDQLQKEVIKDVLSGLEQPDLSIQDVSAFVSALFHSFYAQQSLINILFSGSQSSVLPLSIERELKEYIFRQVPSARENAEFNISLTYRILGGFHVYQQYHQKYGIDYIVQVIDSITNSLA